MYNVIYLWPNNGKSSPMSNVAAIATNPSVRSMISSLPPNPATFCDTQKPDRGDFSNKPQLSTLFYGNRLNKSCSFEGQFADNAKKGKICRAENSCEKYGSQTFVGIGVVQVEGFIAFNKMSISNISWGGPGMIYDIPIFEKCVTQKQKW